MSRSNRIYLVGAYTEEDFEETSEILAANGWYVMNSDDESDLRVAIATLTTCDALCILEGWWSAGAGYNLIAVASMLHLRTIRADEVRDARPGVR